MMKTGTGYALFCEDVREEVGGTSTYVGVRVRPMECKKFPFHLNRICAVVHYRGPLDLPFDGLEVRVSFPGEVDPIVSKMDRSGFSFEELSEGPQELVIESRYMFMGVPISEPGQIIVEGRTGDEPFAEYGSLQFIPATGDVPEL